jgi:hypothetical protein
MEDKGVKFDDDKIKPHVVLGDFALALEEVCKVGGYGIKKYSASNWLKVPNAVGRYEDATLRHWLKMRQGEENDNESLLLHRAHIAWNALACLELELRERQRALSV